MTSLGKHPRRESCVSEYAEMGTLASGYEECGPYHCGDCRWLRESNRCVHPVVVRDFELRDRKRGDAIQVDPERGCCRFVRQ